MINQLGMFKQEIPPSLVHSGITTEQSDYRIHVGYKMGTVWVFPTDSGRAAVERAEQIGITPDYPQDPAVHDGRGPTARGFQIPPSLLDGCQAIPIPPDLLSRYGCSVTSSTSQKGQSAQDLVFEMFRRGIILLPMIPQVVIDAELQRKGQDMLVTRNATIQIKCDFYACYTRKDGYTRGLFLQTHERNPLRQF